MFGDEHSLGQRIRFVSGHDGNLRLPENFPRIEIIGDEMDRCAGGQVAGLQHGSCVSNPLYLGSSEGWILRIRPLQRSTKSAGRMRMKPASAIRSRLLRFPVLCSASIELALVSGCCCEEAG